MAEFSCKSVGRHLILKGFRKQKEYNSPDGQIKDCRQLCEIIEQLEAVTKHFTSFLYEPMCNIYHKNSGVAH